MEPVGVVRGADIKNSLRAKIEFTAMAVAEEEKNEVLATMARPSLEFHKAHVHF